MKIFFRKFFLITLLLACGLLLNLQVNAAQVTSTGLLLEYKFNGNFNDSSVNNRATTYTGVTLNTDEKQSINYATFNNGKISTNLGWSTDEYGQYTISMWYKGTSTTRQSIINGLLYAEGNICNAYSIGFNCSNIFDNKWHNIILRKNGKYNRVYIDGKLTLDYQGIVGALNYNNDLGYGTITYRAAPTASNFYTGNFYMSGSVLGYRVYNRELSASEIVDLYLEYSYLQNSTLNSYEYTVSTLPSWTSSYGTGNYTISFDVSTLLSQRINDNNRVHPSFVDGNNYPQTFFSTITSDSKSMNIALTNNYLCSTPYGNFDCTKLKDEKKHTFLVRKNSTSFNIYLDGINVLTSTSTGTTGNIGNTLSTNNSTFTLPGNTQSCPVVYSGYNFMAFNQNGVIVCNTKNQFLGQLTNLSIYNGFMTDNQLFTFFTQLGYTVQNSIINGVIKGYLNNILTINFTGIQLADKKENVDYEYSYDNINFTKISSGSLVEQTTSSGSLIYEYLLDVSGQADGTGNLYFRTNKLGVTKFISKVTFVKESVYDIAITEPNINDETSKDISASFSRGTLSMSLTRGNICNNTLVFEKYSNLIFNSTKDNGVRICYKGVDSTTGKEFYKLSSPIQGIVSSVVYFGQDIFDYYTSWKFSPNIRNNDSTFMMLGLLANGSVSTQNYTTTTTTSTNISSMVDINGDGLIDLLYIGQTADGLNKRSIMVNNGDYSFNTVYKCASKANSYYGDCAGNIDLGN